mgnify:CR=1 FL=1
MGYQGEYRFFTESWKQIKTAEYRRTKGDANEVSDPGAVSYEQYLGKMIFSLPYVGYLISVFKRRSIVAGNYYSRYITDHITNRRKTWKSRKGRKMKKEEH